MRTLHDPRSGSPQSSREEEFGLRVWLAIAPQDAMDPPWRIAISHLKRLLSSWTKKQLAS